MIFRRRFLWPQILFCIVAVTEAAWAQVLPSIMSQPQSQVADFGATVVLRVSAAGTEPLRYQWRNEGGSMADYNNVAGSQTPTLYLVGVGQQDVHSYSVVIQNAEGSVTSAVASLTVGTKVVLNESFENGFGRWAPLVDSAPLLLDPSRNHTAKGSFSAETTNSARKMFYRLSPKEENRVRLTLWIYDAGGAQMALGELRAYTAFSGYARYCCGMGLRQCLAVGIYDAPDFASNNTGSLAGESLDPAMYQGRVMSGTNSGWFNLNAAGAPARSPGWHKFQIDRSKSGGTVDFYVDGVLGREIAQAPQIDNSEISKVNGWPLDTVTIGSRGMDEDNPPPAVPVRAWFDDVTVEGFDDNTVRSTIASHGPIPDLMQLHETGTNTAVVNVTPVNVWVADGSAAAKQVGLWLATNSEMYAQDIRGYLEYAVNAPVDNAYRIEIEGRERDFKWPQADLRLEVSVDGEVVGRAALPYGDATDGLAHCFTPFLRAGWHTVGVLWDNARPECALVVHAVRLQSLSGGATVHGMQAWVANRLKAQCGMDAPPAASLVSPFCLEGRGGFLSMMKLLAGTQYPLSPVPVQHGAGAHWFANVPLSPTGVTRVEASYQNGGLMETNDIAWKVTNLLEATNTAVRQGDSLLLTALPPGETNGSVLIQVDGHPIVSADGSTPVPYQFDVPGTFTVTGLYAPTGASATITVSVVAASFSGPLPARMGRWTYWDCTNLPPGVVLDGGPLVMGKVTVSERAQRLTKAPPLGVNGRELRLLTRSPGPSYLLARLGPHGSILAETSILGFRMYVPPYTDLRLLSTQADGTRIDDVTFVLSPVVAGIGLNFSVEADGVTLDDGSVARSLGTVDFDELGICRVRLIVAPRVAGSICMHPAVRRDAEGSD